MIIRRSKNDLLFSILLFVTHSGTECQAPRKPRPIVVIQQAGDTQAFRALGKGDPGVTQQPWQGCCVFSMGPSQHVLGNHVHLLCLPVPSSGGLAQGHLCLPFPQQLGPDSTSLILSGSMVYSAQEMEVSVARRGSHSAPSLGLFLSEMVAKCVFPPPMFVHKFLLNLLQMTLDYSVPS